jgi:MOSC domain-containing protein YiiM
MSASGPAVNECTLIEVRVGKVRRLGNTEIITGIDKQICQGAVRVRALGVEGDEQGEKVIHGGPDKAVLQYARHHYDAWKQEFPESGDLFKAGGFGENFVADSFDEDSVCIGDVVQVGSVTLQVAQPRQPCFKLNHRFQQPSMSRRAQQSHKTGWYYRVLQEGIVQAGDVIRLIERPNSPWSVSRVQYYLYDNTRDFAATTELANLSVLAADMRRLFEKRLASKRIERWDGRLSDEKPQPSAS